ncbi:MAG: glycosyltransferase family protein [Nitrososphaerota archaeon]
MRAYFGICGIGMGHAARSSLLIKALVKNGWEVAVSSYSDGAEYLEAIGIPVNKVDPVSYGVLPDGKVSIKLTIFKNLHLPLKVSLQTAREVSSISCFGPSVVISDTRVSTVIAAKLLEHPVVLILNQFNVLVEYHKYKTLVELVENGAQLVTKFWEMADKIVISDFPPPYTISRMNLALSDVAKSKSTFVGPLFEVPRQKLSTKDEVRKKYGIPSGKPLIFAHISGPIFEKTVLAEKLVRIVRKLDRYFFVITLAEPKAPNIKREENMLLMNWVENPDELYDASDVVISRSGHGSIVRALAFGKPMVLIPIRAHGEQKSNAESVAKHGAGIVINEDELNEEVLGHALDRILTDDAYSRNVLSFKRLMEKLDPVNVTVSIIEELAHKP